MISTKSTLIISTTNIPYTCTACRRTLGHVYDIVMALIGQAPTFYEKSTSKSADYNEMRIYGMDNEDLHTTYIMYNWVTL